MGRRLRLVSCFHAPCLCRYLSLSSRARYLRDALQSYKSLFEDMDPFIEQLVARMRERGFRIPHYQGVASGR